MLDAFSRRIVGPLSAFACKRLPAARQHIADVRKGGDGAMGTNLKTQLVIDAMNMAIHRPAGEWNMRREGVSASRPT